MIHQYKVELQERMKNRERERENNHFFKREFIENNMRREKKYKK